jgi:hypothetical protein
MMARDRAVDRWLPQQVGPSFDALEADPSRKFMRKYPNAMKKLAE